MSETVVPTILNGKFFKIIKLEDKKVEAKCVVCKIDKLINGFVDVTSNFLTHLKRKHSNLIPDYDKCVKEEKALLKKRRMDSKQQDNSDTKQNTLMNYGIKRTDKFAEKVDFLIMNLIIKGMLPLSLVELPEFISLIKGLNDQATVMSRRTLGRRIDECFDRMLNKMKEFCTKIEFVCITADAWTTKGNSKSFLGCTIHWITPDLKRESACLAFKRFKGRHTFDRIYELLTEIFQNFKIQSKITSVVTDNGSNFVKTFRIFGQQEKDSTNEDSADNENDEMNDENDDQDDYDIVDLDSVLNLRPEETEICLPQHQRCMSHTLSLVCVSDTKKFTSKIHNSAFSKCHGIWNKIKRSSLSSEISQNLMSIILITPSATRWNSLYDSVVSILQHKENLEELCKLLKIPIFNEIELEYLEEWKICVQPIAIGLDRLQGDKNCFYGELLPTVIQIKNKISDLKAKKGLKYCEKYVEMLLYGFNKRFEKYLDVANAPKAAIIAAVTHPYFKLRWLPEDKREILQDIVLKLAFDEVKVFDKNTDTSNIEQKMKDDDFFEFSDTVTSQEDSKNQIRLEFLRYLDDKRTQIEILHEYPLIKQLFIKYNTTVPSSGPVERIFSYSGNLFQPRRMRLNDFISEKLLLLKLNDL